MATETKTEKEVTVTASTKVAALIVAVVQAVVGAISKKRQLADGVRAEADRQGLDRKQASQMVALSYVAAFKMEKASESELAQFNLKMRPDVSKVIALAFPDKPSELAKAYAHNDKLPANTPKQNRIGENNLLRIARGEITCAEALATKQASKERKTTLDNVFTPAQRWANSLAVLFPGHKIGEKGHLSVDEAREGFNVALDLYLNPPTKAKAAAKK